MDILRKAIFLGLGAIVMTQEKAEALVDELIKKGEVASAERYTAVDKLLKEADRQQKEFQDKVNETVQKTIANMGLPTKSDWEEMREILKRIELRLTMTERKETGV
jgi:polyhydroxyalkanoate synthesis regulator phasin